MWGCVAVLVVLAGCGDPDEPAEADEDPVVVEIARVEHGRIREIVTRVGNIRATAIVGIRPEISGVVREIHFDEGDEVEADALLFSLDSRKLRKQLAAEEAALQAARSRAEFAELMYERFEQLLHQDAAPAAERDRRRTEWETAQADIERSEAQIALLRERLWDTEIRMPMNGHASESKVDRGDLATAGQLLTVVYAPSLEARFSVPEDAAGRVCAGQTIEAHVAAFPDTPFTGVVSFIDPGVDEHTRTFLVKAHIDEPDHRLKSGMFAVVNLILKTEDDKPVIPNEALVATQAGYVVYVVEEATAHRRSVEIGLRKAGMVQIVDGLQEGETLVVSGQMRLTDGAEVRVVEESNQARSSAPTNPRTAKPAHDGVSPSRRVAG